MKKIIITLFALGGLFITGCMKDDTLYLKPIKAAITRQVSFKSDLVPIFAGHCAKVGCHVSGGQKPDLSSADNAYNSITSMGLVNTATPSSSIIYGRLTGALTPAMPFDAPASDPSQINELILAWITQGAKNN
ncbi:MAG: hypothetical protein ACYDCN_10115 [Bacteroidia bacterium]